MVRIGFYESDSEYTNVDFFYQVILLLMDIGAEMVTIDSDDGGPVINLYKITRQFRQSSKL